MARSFATHFAVQVCALATLALSAALPVQAAGDNTAQRDREQLQRSRAALREANEQRQALQAEKSAWTEERKRLAAQLARAKAADAHAATRLKDELQQLRDAQMQTEVLLAALRDGAAQAAQRATQRETELLAQVAQAERESADRMALVRAVATLLERSTGALGSAESANSRLHAAGLAAVETFRREIGTQELSITDPLGLRAVRRENQSDALREALDKQRIGAPKAAALP